MNPKFAVERAAVKGANFGFGARRGQSDFPGKTLSWIHDEPRSEFLRVKARPGDPSRGWLTVAGRHLPVALGRGGIKANKREGDGGTPRGAFRVKRLWWRADRAPRPRNAAAGAAHPDR